ncbi:MAG: hypothetical protein GTN80_10660 [Nitrososphaeria archaeon]|nr:hypothetical protein [Nitrososphaeria archaeon]NIQ34080.1 hypothetical protein [Nitrososphaeria archaeon]
MSPKNREEIRERIEKGIGSRGRLRILGELAKDTEKYFTKYSLERLTGLKPVHVRAGLKVLVELGWVEEYIYRPRKYRINLEDEDVDHIIRFLKVIRYI